MIEGQTGVSTLFLEPLDARMERSEGPILSLSDGEYIEKRNLNHPRKGPYYPRMPHLMLKRAVRGMIPYQKPRGREAFKRLRVDIGEPKEIEEKDIETIDHAKMKNTSKYITLSEVSKVLGAKFNG